MYPSELKIKLKNPVYHTQLAQGVQLENYQIQILRALSQYPRVVVSSAHNLGKTFVASKAVLWHCSAFPGSKTITTAPTFRQVELLLWSEIRAGFHKSKYALGGEMLTTRWKIKDDWWAVGVASRKEAGSDTHGSGFQGVHAPYVFLVFDEAQGIAPDIWRQAEGMMTSANVKMLAIGNPLQKGTMFHQATQDKFWKHIKLTCFDSPNLMANGIKNKSLFVDLLNDLDEMSDEERMHKIEKMEIVKPHLLTAQWCIQMAFKHGLDHPLVKGKILGEFPDDSENVLIPLDLIETAQNVKFEDDESASFIGVDVARMGSDKTVIIEISKKGIRSLKRLVKKDNAEVAGILSQIICQSGKVKTVAIDSTGLGSGVLDILQQNRKLGQIPDCKIIETHFGAACTTDADKKHYANLKSKMFHDVKEALVDGFSLNQDSIWQEQLADIRYKPDSKGRIMLESKEDYKARTGKNSPDEADALALAIFAKNFFKTKKAVTFDLGGVNLSKNSQWSLK